MKSLTKQEMKNIIEGKRTTERIPNLCSFWIFLWKMEDEETQRQWKDWLNKQVYDMSVVSFRQPLFNSAPKGTPNEYCWLPADTPITESSGLDNVVWIKDWEDTDFIEDMYAKFPTSDMPNPLSYSQPDHAKYVVFNWFYCFFERHWSLRGMENALTDYYLYPDEVHRFYQKLTDFYI